MSCHFSDVPNHQTTRVTPRRSRSDLSHLGATGYELDTTTFTDEDRAATAEQTKEYHETEDLVLTGDLYRIDSPETSNFFTVAVVSKDKTHGFMVCYRRMGGVNTEIKRVRLAGLDKDKSYYVRELDKTLSGSTLMNVGIVPEYKGRDFDSVKYHFEER